MKRALPFVAIGLLSFGATHVILTARAAAMRPAPPPRAAVRTASTTAAPAAALPCRPVRVVYAGSIRPVGEGCAGAR